jgi:hypothetical protein
MTLQALAKQVVLRHVIHMDFAIPNPVVIHSRRKARLDK